MKSLFYSTTTLLAVCLAANLHAQDKAPTAPEAVPAQNPDAIVVRVEEELQQAQAEADRAQSEAEQATAYAPGAMSFGGQWTTAGIPGVFGGSSKADSTLVIRTSEPDPKSVADSEEDLHIMGRILEKSVSQMSEQQQPQAMGIRLVTVGAHPMLRNLQIEGFGAVFFLNVHFPLVGPASKIRNEDATKQPSNSTWDEAKRELYGEPAGTDGRANGEIKEDYDPKRVENLKNTLIDALKNAANIRGLKPDENVLVVVKSGGSGGTSTILRTSFQRKLIESDRGNAAPDAIAGGRGGGGGAGGSGSIGKPVIVEKHLRKLGSSDRSTLTLRARKADIDSFAGGKLSLEEFRNKVKVLVY